MTDFSLHRAILLGEYIVENKCTVRAAAKRFAVSKSTVHKDVTERLKQTSPSLYADVKKVLEINKSERHLRGGEATRLKYSFYGKNISAKARKLRG